MNAMDATIGTTMWQCKQVHVSCRATMQECNIHAIHTLHNNLASVVWPTEATTQEEEVTIV